MEDKIVEISEAERKKELKEMRTGSLTHRADMLPGTISQLGFQKCCDMGLLSSEDQARSLLSGSTDFKTRP